MYQTDVFKNLRPIEFEQGAQTSHSGRNRQLIGGLAALFGLHNLGERRLQTAFEPALHRSQSAFFVLQLRAQAVGEMRRDLRLTARQFVQ